MLIAAGAIAAAILLGGCAQGSMGNGPSGSTATEPSPTASAPETAPTPSIPPSAAPPAPSATSPTATVALAPSSVTIPAIELAEPLIDLGILPDGSMEVPADFNDVGWFAGGGKPGGTGPTVIAGHVDSASGPAIFSRLTELVPGDRVQVTDVAGAVFEYEVYRVADYAKADFPTLEVFGVLSTDELRLITCTGTFDRAIGHYDDNRVVFAARVGAGL